MHVALRERNLDTRRFELVQHRDAQRGLRLRAEVDRADPAEASRRKSSELSPKPWNMAIGAGSDMTSGTSRAASSSRRITRTGSEP
jgi:hypothetical protein